MAVEEFDPKDPEAMERLRAFFSPQHVDQQIRQAIHICWMLLPPKRQKVEEVEKEIRRLVDRALRDLREDAATFGLGRGKPVSAVEEKRRASPRRR